MAFVDSAPAVGCPCRVRADGVGAAEPALPARRSRWLFGSCSSPGRLAWAAALLVVVGRSFIAGRLLPRRHRRIVPARRHRWHDAAEQVRERILLVDLGDHLDRSQMMLVELVSAGGTRRSVDISTEQARARAAGGGQSAVSADGAEDGRRGDGLDARRAGAHARRHRGQPLDGVAGGSGSGAAPHRIQGIAVQGAGGFVAGAGAAEGCHSGANGPANARDNQELRYDHDNHETEADITIAGALAIASPVTAQTASSNVASRAAELAQLDAERAREVAEVAQDRDREQRDREREQRERERDQENSNYDRGQQALDQSRWDRAVTAFDRVIEGKGPKADAALYWKAYAQNKQGQRPEALGTIGELTKAYPKSRYLQDAKALEVEVRRDSGQPVRPENESDEEMKLLGLNGLQSSAPDEAIPMLQKFLTGNELAQAEGARPVRARPEQFAARRARCSSASPRATRRPICRCKAIQYLGIHGGPESRAALADVYASSTDIDVKRRILRAFMVAGEKGRLLTAAQSEQNSELRDGGRSPARRDGRARRAVDALSEGIEPWTSRSRFSGRCSSAATPTRLIDLAKTEQNPELRRVAVRNLGLIGSQAHRRRARRDLRHGEGSRRSRSRRSTRSSSRTTPRHWSPSHARSRTSTMKKEIVQKLSVMQGSKVATDYLLELLNK